MTKYPRTDPLTLRDPVKCTAYISMADNALLIVICFGHNTIKILHNFFLLYPLKFHNKLKGLWITSNIFGSLVLKLCLLANIYCDTDIYIKIKLANADLSIELFSTLCYFFPPSSASIYTLHIKIQWARRNQYFLSNSHITSK